MLHSAVLQLPVIQHAPAPPRERTPIVRAQVPDAKWFDWRWQLANMLTDAEDVSQLFALTERERAGFAAADGLFRVGITPYYASLMDPTHASCPIRLQSLPAAAEALIRDEELRDPLGEDSHNPAPSIVHKYPDRVLFLVVDRCGIYCRHCNRRRLVGGDDPPSRADLEAGLAYIERTTRVRDVLLSGGDPFLLTTRRLGNLIQRLRAIKHVETIRIGTRLPVVCPMRIDDELVAMLRPQAGATPVFVNTHFNHIRELTPEALAGCAKLVDAGIPVGNQTVLLRGINSSTRSLRALMRGLLRARVRPYYLFQGDTVLGTDHLRTPVESAMELYQSLRGWMNSMAVPMLVLDAPGGGGKVPLIPSYVKSIDEHRVVFETYRGITLEYPQPRERDCSVAYDDVQFAGVEPDDDREGST